MHNLEVDYLYPNLNDCPNLELFRNMLRQTLNFYKTNDKYLKCMKLAKEKLNLTESKNPLYFVEFLDDIHSRKVGYRFCPNLKFYFQYYEIN